MGNAWLDKPDSSIFEKAWNHLRQIHPELCIDFFEEDNPHSMVVSHDGSDSTIVFTINLDVITNEITYTTQRKPDAGCFDSSKDIRYLIDDLLIITGLGC
jgi:hypothetical protein